MKFVKQVFLFLIFCFLCGCDFTDDKLVIINKSGRSIMAITTPYDSIWGGINLSDTVGQVLSPNHQKHMPCFNSYWESFVANCPGHKLRVIFMDIDTLKKYPWPVIKKEKKFLSFDSIHVDTLKKWHWQIVYR